jgi:predicted PurR-regulated permease PerM
MIVVRFLLTVIIVALLYLKGEEAAGWVLSFANRLAGRQGREAAILAGKAIRGVALGVVLTGLIQAALGGAGLALAGVPGTALLTGIIFVLCLAQLGPMPVLLPAVGWLYWSGEALWGTILLVWTVFVGTFDNFLRPFLIRRGVDLPLVLVFTGVIGGLIAFGVIGLFIGPVVLAVTYTLLAEWVRGGTAEGDAPPAP